MDGAAASRQAFVAAQIDALGSYDFLVVGVPVPPFDAVQILRGDDSKLSVLMSMREAGTTYTPEEEAQMTKLGLASTEQGWGATAPPTDGAAAAALVEELLANVLKVTDSTPVDIRHGSRRDEVAAGKKVEEMRGRIEPVIKGITSADPVRDPDGDYIVDIGKSRVFVAPRALPGRPAILRVFAITNGGVDLTAELGLFLARLNFTLMFGRFSLDADHQAVWFDETLLGDHVTDEELRFTIEMVASTAAEWDQRIAQMFGGSVRDPDASAAEAGAKQPVGNKPGEGGYL